MINQALLNPRSIVVVGGSNDVQKPGGAVLRNLIDGNFQGNLYVTNLKESLVQGIQSFPDPAQLPDVDLAIIAIAAKYIPDTVELLVSRKNTRGFIILSAGFSEENHAGKLLEQKVVEIEGYWKRALADYQNLEKRTAEEKNRQGGWFADWSELHRGTYSRLPWSFYETYPNPQSKGL